MTNVLMELIDRRDKAARLDPVQVELAFGISDMMHYLNSVLLQKKGYRFYINNRLLKTNLEEAVRAGGLEIERVLSIEYEADEEDEPDVTLRLDDTLAFLKAVQQDEVHVLYCSTYSGRMRIYEISGSGALLPRDTEYRGIRGVMQDEEIYMYSASNEVMAYGSGTVLFSIPHGEVTCMAVSRGKIALGMDDGRCYLYVQELCEVCRLDLEITSAHFRDGHVRYTCLSGRCALYDIGEGRATTGEMLHECTSMDAMDGVAVYGTPISRLVVDDGNERTLETSIRYINRVALYGGFIAAVASQHVVSILDLRNGDETKRIMVDEQITDMAWAGNTIFIAHGSNISGYLIPGSILLNE
jgi:hypothetical protein